MKLKETINKIRCELGMEIIDNSQQEKMEELKWNILFDNAIKICDADDVEFDGQTYCIQNDEEFCISRIEHTVVPILITQKHVLSSLEDRLNKIGIQVTRNTFYETIENRKWEMKKKLINGLCDSEDIDFELYSDITLTEDGYEFSVKQRIVPLIDKYEDVEEEIINADDIYLTLNIDSVAYEKKPDKKQIGAIQKRIGGCKRSVTVEEFIEEIENGTSFKAAALNGNKNADWESQQVFALDIDNDDASIARYGVLMPEDAVKRFEGLGVSPAFYYESFSSTEKRPKFRLIFIVRNPVTDIRIRNAIQIALMTIMPEADKACKDLSRLFFGTNSECRIVNINQMYADIYNLVQGVIIYSKQQYKASKATKIIKAYCEFVGLNMINGYPDVRLYENSENGKMTATSIIYIIENAVNFPKTLLFSFNVDEQDAYRLTKAAKGKKKLKKQEIENRKHSYKTLIRGLDFVQLEHSCELWAKFINGSRWCYHNEIFGMACNMWRVEGAQSMMIKAIDDNKVYIDKYNKINTIKSCSAYGYMPSRCSNFCPYYERCSNTGLNILQSLDNTRGSIRKVEDVTSIKLDAAEKKLNDSFLEAYSEEGNIITIIKGGTGVGKTTVLNNISNFNGLSISYSNHRLGQDIVSRVKINNSLHLKELNIDNKEILNEFKRLQSIGAYKQARLYMEQYKNRIMEKKELCEIEARDADKIIESITEYFENISKANTTNGTIFSTHKKILEINNDNINTYIIDEDILMSSIISTSSLNILEINSYIKLSNKHKAKTIKKCLSNLRIQIFKAIENPNRAFKIEKVNVDIDELNRLIQNECTNLKVNLREILNISSIVANDNGDVLGMTIGKLPNKKCIILSATANENIYRSLLPNREIRFVDITDIETEGKVILHYTGCSRNKLSKEFDECLDKIKHEAKGINNVITFAKFENKFRKAGFNPIAHFGACSGLDSYKGQDLIVAGTPHVDERVYRLLATIIAGKVEEHEKISYINAKRNGFEFYFNTYEECSLLREIQFYYIESELVQAIGRARVLRTNATVHVFSNYPVRGAVLYDKKIS